MAQSDARFGYRAKLARTDHDLSRPFGFTAAPGMLLPCFADLATPGETYYIKHDLSFLRTAPLAAPAMVDVKVHYESFFVPLQMIYQPSENTIYSLANIQSSLYTQASEIDMLFPRLDYLAIVEDCMQGHARDEVHQDCFRLADMLDLNADNFAYDANNPSRFAYTPHFFPWQILAYHTIFNYYYRLDDKSQFDHSDCNWDNAYFTSTAINPASKSKFFTIHQRPWNFDYFTSMFRSPIVSDANMQQIVPNVTTDLTTIIPAPQKANGASPSFNDDFANIGSRFNGSNAFNAGSLNTSLIRQMFVNEKLAMITGRTRKTYDAQVLAHFGVEVPHDVKHDISLIGQDSFPVHIGEVTSLASTEGSGLGDLAGKGWAQSPEGLKTHKFIVPCHGVIMTIFSIEPLKRYYGGFAKQNAILEAYDIPQPEFDRLGNVPMFRYEAGEIPLNTGTAVDIVGWKERYYQFKRRAPKVTLAFQHGVQHRGYNSYEAYMISTPPFGCWSNSRSARPDIESRFYIDRSCMNGLMLVNYETGWIDGTGEGETENWNVTPWLAYARDPFIVDSYVKVKKVSWMSKDGEPVYNF